MVRRRPGTIPDEVLRTQSPDETNGFQAWRAAQLMASYRHWTGRALVDDAPDPTVRARMLYLAPFVVAAHGLGEDPIFDYANQRALALFEADWTTFTATPSRLSAEPDEREQRAQLLQRVRERGYVDDYAGARVSLLGRRFRIHRATVWNVLAADGAPAGQAVMFHEWEYL